ncbi:MAG: histidine phosphatase family protein, partial [Alphaproteobacteria bacterium]|nr:histidine phosphatase family protein [Alphaproteobacteria bacterium]
HAPPGGESFTDVLARVGPAMDRLTETLAGSDIVVVAHGGSIRAAVAHALEITPDRALAITIDNCSLTRIDHIDGPGEGGNWSLGAVNTRPGVNRV